MGDWTGITGVILSAVGVGVSGGAWFWAARANSSAEAAQSSADEAKEATASLAELLENEARENPDLTVFRIGAGANVVNKTLEDLFQVAIGPLDNTLRLDNLAYIGDIARLGGGSADVAKTFPTWGDAKSAFVYWVDSEGHRRYLVCPVIELDAPSLAGLTPTP